MSLTIAPEANPYLANETTWDVAIKMRDALNAMRRTTGETGVVGPVPKTLISDKNGQPTIALGAGALMEFQHLGGNIGIGPPAQLAEAVYYLMTAPTEEIIPLWRDRVLGDPGSSKVPDIAEGGHSTFS